MFNFICKLFAKKEDSAPVSLTEAPSHRPLAKMTKQELDDLGAHHGIKLDRRKKKSVLVQELQDAGITHK